MPWRNEPDTVATRTGNIPLEYARYMLNLRLSELAKKEDAPFQSAGAVAAGEGLRVFDGERLQILCDPDRSRGSGVATCEQELRRALERPLPGNRGVAEVRADALRILDEGVEREKTRASAAYAGELLDAAENRWVVSGAETHRAILRGAIEALDSEKCQSALAKAWSEGDLAIDSIGALDLGPDGGKTLREAYEKSRTVDVLAPKKHESSEWAYASKPDRQGKIAEREHLEDVDSVRVKLENGVRIEIKKTDFKERQILFTARLGEGYLTLDAPDRAIGFVAGKTFVQGGLEAHSADDLRRLFAGKQVVAGFDVGEDFAQFLGATTHEDLLLECELVCAYFTHPGYRSEALAQFEKQIGEYYDALVHQPVGPLYQTFLPALYCDDLRFGLLPRAKVEAVTNEAVRKWFDPELANAPLTLSFVGDLDIDQVLDACSRTFGLLPERRAMKSYEERRKIKCMRTGLDMREEVDTKTPKSLVFCVFPATDGRDPSVRHRLSFLGRVLDDRLRLEVREKLGAAYSPSADAATSRVHEGDGALRIQATADPEKVKTLLDACLSVADLLAKNGTTQEEVDRLREPVIAALRDEQRDNRFWLDALSETHAHPGFLAEVPKIQDDWRSIKPAEISGLAAQYLAKERASVLVVAPKP